MFEKIGLDQANRDEPVLKPIDGHLGKTSQSSVFVSISYCEASEIGLECSQWVSFSNFIRKYYQTILWVSQNAFIVANGGHIGVTIGGHIGNFSGVTKKKGKTFLKLL